MTKIVWSTSSQDGATGKHGSHNPNKTATKIENNHHSEPSENKLNERLATTELKKPHPSYRLVGGVELLNGLVPHPHVVYKNSGRTS